LEHNCKLYVDAKGGIEEYQIMPDGSLELISFISTFSNSIANAVILGDTLFVATSSGYDTNHKIYVINISSSPMQLISQIDVTDSNGVFRMSGNYEYFVITPSGSSISLVYEKNTLQYISQLVTGGYYSIHENYLFKQSSINDSTFLNISDIQDLNNIVDISSLYLGINQQNVEYFFFGDTLFVTQNQQVAIVNISDLTNPVLTATIDNIPSLPPVNHITMLIKYNDILMFGNKETKFWLYDISEISSPQFISIDYQFVNGTSVKNSLLLHEDNIYYTRSDRNICLLNAAELPDLNIIAEYGNSGQFQFFDFTYPYLLYSDPLRQKQFCLKINDQDPEPICLADSPNGYVSKVCYNDSLICFLTSDFGTDNLVLCSYNQDCISIENTIPLGTVNFNHVFFRGDYLILCGFNPGEISINNVNVDHTLTEIGNFTVGIRAFIINQNSQCSEDYLYIKSQYNGEYVIEVFENQVPFNQISSFELICNNHEFDIFFFLENDKVLLCDYYYPGGLYYLCDYSFPDIFEWLDSFSTNTLSFSLNDHYLFGHEDLNGLGKFYSWKNDEIELVQTHEFDVEFFNVFSLPDESRFIAGGRYNIQEYSCNYVSVKDNQILNPDLHLTNYPNPFNPSTTISFSIEQNEQNHQVELSIYNIKGQKVKTLMDCKTAPGKYNCVWNGRNDSGKRVSSGQYTARLTINGEEKAVRKMMVVK
jgi:hypothetical protein